MKIEWNDKQDPENGIPIATFDEALIWMIRTIDGNIQFKLRDNDGIIRQLQYSYSIESIPTTTEIKRNVEQEVKAIMS